MATLNLTPSDFADIALIFLYDKALHPNEVVDENENFNEFMKRMSAKGIKAELTKYYLHVDSKRRFDYRRIKDIFDGTSEQIQQIRIVPEDQKDKEKEKTGIMSKVLKKLMLQGPAKLEKDEWKLISEMVEWTDENREE